MKIYRSIALALALMLSVASEAFAAQGTGCMPTTGTVSGLQFAQDVNAAIAALISSNSGASAPATDCTAVAIKGQVWLDTSVTPNALRQYDGSSWVTIGYLDSSNHLFAPPIGGGISTVTAAATTDIGALPNAAVTVNGTTPITSLGSSAVAGTIHVLTFSGVTTLTYNATSLITPGAANITTAAGGVAFAAYLGSGNWKILFYHPPGVAPQMAAYSLRGNATGSSADPTDVLIASLTAKTTVVGADLMLIADSAASNALKKVSLSNLATFIGGVSSIDTATGAMTISGMLARSSQDLRVIAASKSDQQTGSSVVNAVTPAHAQDHDSAAKAWGYILVNGTVSAGYGISSVSHTSTGNWTVTFSTAFASANYACTVNSASGGSAPYFFQTSQSTATTTTLTLNAVTNGGSPVDANFTIHCFGRQ